MALHNVLAMVLAASVALASQAPARMVGTGPGDPDLPCPNQMLIKPCTCHTYTPYAMTMNCSLINTNADLERVFSIDFPFRDFQSLIIEHDTSTSNNLTEIKADIFGDITFERVTITGTELQSIDENVFSYSHGRLVSLNLQNNKLNHFPFETIPLYARLETLLLDNNKLTTLEKFGSLSLRTLSIGNNHNLGFTYDVLEEIPDLVNLNMESIGLKFIPKHMFANHTQVYTINFNDNELQILEEFTLDPLSKSVGRLLLANNKLNDSIQDSLHGLMKDAIIDLSNNKITRMTQELWKPLFDQVINGMVDLTGNSLVCGCDMSWLFLTYPSDVYLPIITERTTCYDGSQVAFLDKLIFEKHCI